MVPWVAHVGPNVLRTCLIKGDAARIQWLFLRRGLLFSHHHVSSPRRVLVAFIWCLWSKEELTSRYHGSKCFYHQNYHRRSKWFLLGGCLLSHSVHYGSSLGFGWVWGEFSLFLQIPLQVLVVGADTTIDIEEHSWINWTKHCCCYCCCCCCCFVQY